ncbi:MAG: hypothetical protein V3S89_06430 [Desulfobacterales bacterium]
MDPGKKYAIVYPPQVKTHLRAIGRKLHSLIRRAIENQLMYDPNKETRNQKPLKKVPDDPSVEWEIRFGPDNRFRVFYDIHPDNAKVFILAIGVKRGNKLLIGKEEISL